MLLWIGFLILIILLLALDLGIFNRKIHALGFKESLGWTSVWIAIAVIFNFGLYFIYEHQWIDNGTSGKQAFLEFFAGYLVEKSLSLDNIFVMAVVFAYFGIPPQFQHRALFWGILGALIMRGIMIGVGTTLLAWFHWMIYVFGGLLILTAIKFLFSKEEDFDPQKNSAVKLVQKIYPVEAELNTQKFFLFRNGIWCVTPLFLAVVMIENMDVLFAVDSIPAVFAITQDPFIVFTSNVFAILGLRSLYFVLSSVLNQFKYMKHSLFCVLIFVGLKMVFSFYVHIPIGISLIVIAFILAIGIMLSLMRRNHVTHISNQ